MELSARTKSWACIGFLVFASSLSLFAQGDRFNTPGNILISDQFNNRVIEVNPRNHKIVWLPNFHVLITDQVNERIIEVTLDKKIVWQYGRTGVSGDGFNHLNNPNSAELLSNGHILIADENNNRVIEVNRHHQILWSYGCATCTQLSGAAFASRLRNGDTLITDSNNNRILEVDSTGDVVSTYYTNNRPGSVSNPLPTRAVRLRNGNTLISDQFNMQVIEIDPKQNIVFTQGTIGVAATGFDMLNAPYDAKVIGD
jgi:hypothetical protein